MQITSRTPYARGVDTLMYVGDVPDVPTGVVVAAKGLNAATALFAGYKFTKNTSTGWKAFWGALAVWNTYLLVKPIQ